MNQAVYQGSSRRGPEARTDPAAVAAVLSFIFPGLGHAYLVGKPRGAHLRRARVGAHLVLVVWVLLGHGPRGVKLLDPNRRIVLRARLALA